MPRTERKELRLTPELSKQIDDARGDVSFNRFVERALESALGSSKEDVRKPQDGSGVDTGRGPASAPSRASKAKPSLSDTWAR